MRDDADAPGIIQEWPPPSLGGVIELPNPAGYLAMLKAISAREAVLAQDAEDDDA